MENRIENLEKRILELEKVFLNNKPVLNIEELSKYINISKSALYKLTMTGEIPCYKKCKHLFFDRIEIENWLKDKTE